MEFTVDENFNPQEAWMFMASDFTDGASPDFDLSLINSDENPHQSIGCDFVEDLLNEISDQKSNTSSNPEFSSDTSSTKEDSLDSILSVSSDANTTFSSITTDSLSVTSDDDGFVSLERCSASISDFLDPVDFSALLDSLTAAIPQECLSSGVLLDDACLHLSQYVSSGPKQDAELSITPTESTASVAQPNFAKPDISYIELVAKAIMSTPDNSLLLADIYRWIENQYPYYKTTKNSWRNSIRHNLSVNECFVKSKRVKNGRGFYWSIHSSCIEAFKNGDYDRRKARRQVQQCNRAFSSTFEELQVLSTETSNSRPISNATRAVNSHYQVGARNFIPVSSTPQRMSHIQHPGYRTPYQHNGAHVFYG